MSFIFCSTSIYFISPSYHHPLINLVCRKTSELGLVFNAFGESLSQNDPYALRAVCDNPKKRREGKGGRK